MKIRLPFGLFGRKKEAKKVVIGAEEVEGFLLSNLSGDAEKCYKLAEELTKKVWEDVERLKDIADRLADKGEKRFSSIARRILEGIEVPRLFDRRSVNKFYLQVFDSIERIVKMPQSIQQSVYEFENGNKVPLLIDATVKDLEKLKKFWGRVFKDEKCGEYMEIERVLKNISELREIDGKVEELKKEKEDAEKELSNIKLLRDESKEKAINELNETEIDGRTIVVKKANPKNEDNRYNRRNDYNR